MKIHNLKSLRALDDWKDRLLTFNDCYAWTASAHFTDVWDVFPKQGFIEDKDWTKKIYENTSADKGQEDARA